MNSWGHEPLDLVKVNEDDWFVSPDFSWLCVPNHQDRTHADSRKEC
jgi:hypothetical protein